jgi:plasmid stabilization system protein ParE
MQRPIIWSPQALDDIESALNYFLERSPQAARRVYRDVMQHIEHLAEYPFSGRIGRVAGTREWVIPKTPLSFPIGSIRNIWRLSAFSTVPVSGRKGFKLLPKL